MKTPLILFATCISLLAAAHGERPNIVFLFSDDHACNAISAYPGGLFDEIAPTPNIDRIAREGLLFENSFCANSICGPSRACILTGKHSQQNAKVVIIMIGTNNTGHSRQDPGETSDGIARILSVIRARCPKAKVLLLGVFPRGVQPGDPLRKINVAINERIAKFHDGDRIHFHDISGKFLNENGVLPKEIMPDALHPKEKGYAIWAEAIEPKLKELGL